ncbi:MAG: carbamoyl-phosphate synthase large subunit [Bdellovibrionota bacterium]
MPRRNDIQKILIIGSGPIQIGQACEFDYSGTQALRALRAEGYELVLVNSNPATIMTDPSLAHRTYLEPLIAEVLEKIIEKERPDALLPTLGGQVALNLTMELHRLGVLETYGVEVLGASVSAIELAEDRECFKDLLMKLQLPVLQSQVIRTQEEGLLVAKEIGFPLILRPSFTLGGAGGGIVYNREELQEKLQEALRASPTSEVLVEKSILGWKEIEYEVMCDRKNQMVVVCNIENLDPMGVHTGDSITVAPVQTLTDKETQRLREACKKIVRGVGIQTGGCNIQFALDPHSKDWVIVEMNPRVSRSSALASKATGFPIAKIAALLAVGYSLDELKNDITQVTPACFEPALDYIVVKIPRFTFEKFANSEPLLGTQMKSVGEAMAIGRSFKEAFQKAFSSLETGNAGLLLPSQWADKAIGPESIRPLRYDRWYLMAELFRKKTLKAEEMNEITGIDLWFLKQLEEIIQEEEKIQKKAKAKIRKDEMLKWKSWGFSDVYLSKLLKTSVSKIQKMRSEMNVESQLNSVDTCAGEFEAQTPYFYFSHERFASKRQIKPRISEKKKILVIGSGPNRIGQGLEFDYCCVKALEAVKEFGHESLMINCNPETVSTDYDIADRLYFEPLELEYVQRVIQNEGGVDGIICQTGGQTGLRLSQQLKAFPILGTAATQIDRAEDRAKFDRLLTKLQLKRPQSKIAKTQKALIQACRSLGFPVLVRPSYVLGGRAMHILRSESQLRSVFNSLASSPDISWPVLVDRFLDDAIEIDVDCIGDSQDAMVLAVMEHIEEAGIHSGDSSCTLPAVTLPDALIEKVKKLSLKICRELKLCGFLNIQLAYWRGKIYVLEVNPRSSRTLPFVCKAMGQNWVKHGVFAMLGKTFREQGIKAPSLLRSDFDRVAVKQVVFPFLKFPGVDVLLGPEMKSTGEVMCFGKDFNEAFVKGLLASNHRLKKTGAAFVSVKDSDKDKILDICRRLKSIGFRLVATEGTARFLQSKSIVVSRINKVKEGQPHIVDAIINAEIDLLINTTDGESSISDSFSIRRSALQMGIPYFTTLTAARAAVNSLDRWIRGDLGVYSLQEEARDAQRDAPSEPVGETSKKQFSKLEKASNKSVKAS